MADRSITRMVDRGGSRVRIYRRLDHTRPGQQERRIMAARGLRWCTGCREWLPSGDVLRQGRCRPCTNLEERRRYAADPGVREKIKNRRDRRRRMAERVPPLARELLLEMFDGECAYCSEPAKTWDHIFAVSKGGQTVPGNIVPACVSCNSRKRAKDIFAWLVEAPEIKPFTIEYLAHVLGDARDG